MPPKHAGHFPTGWWNPENEWDVERHLQAHGAGLALTGLLLGLTAGKKWFLLTGGILALLFQHSIRNLLSGSIAASCWNSPEEIEKEKFTLKLCVEISRAFHPAPTITTSCELTTRCGPSPIDFCSKGSRGCGVGAVSERNATDLPTLVAVTPRREIAPPIQLPHPGSSAAQRWTTNNQIVLSLARRDFLESPLTSRNRSVVRLPPQWLRRLIA